MFYEMSNGSLESNDPRWVGTRGRVDGSDSCWVCIRDVGTSCET